jgi:hypothetical protein
LLTYPAVKQIKVGSQTLHFLVLMHSIIYSSIMYSLLGRVLIRKEQ